MKSLKLKLDDLRIESFETSTGMEARGTVNGMSGENACVTPICLTDETNPNRATCGTCNQACTKGGDPYATFGCPPQPGSLAYTQCEPSTCDPFICGPY